MGKTTRREGDVICAHCQKPTAGTIEHRFLDDPNRVFRRADVVDLAKAIARGDDVESRTMLDRVFRNDAVVREWIAQGFVAA